MPTGNTCVGGGHLVWASGASAALLGGAADINVYSQVVWRWGAHAPLHSFLKRRFRRWRMAFARRDAFTPRRHFGRRGISVCSPKHIPLDASSNLKHACTNMHRPTFLSDNPFAARLPTMCVHLAGRAIGMTLGAERRGANTHSCSARWGISRMLYLRWCVSSWVVLSMCRMAQYLLAQHRTQL